MAFDFSSAALSDRITRTIDYHAVSQRILKFGERRSWKLIESLATDIANKILAEFRPERVAIEVKKFPIPEARYISVSLTKELDMPAQYKSRWWRW
jgi:7,8-dihydroneopterin aldolase/epimerase/oxygenase